MNDFTKEELELILSDLNHAVFSHYYRSGMAQIRQKIQFIIENYRESNCEHKWMKCLYGEKSIPINLCVLCNLRERR